MVKSQVQLRRTPYDSAKISVMKGSLLSKEELDSFLDKGFDEILKYLSEHGYAKEIDKSYLKYEGFYLVERILNDHLSQLYKKIINSASKNNKVLLEEYYFKYQIHNLMVLLRCKLSKEENIEPYLIGDSSRRIMFIKAYETKNPEEAIVSLSRKLKLNTDEVVKQYKKGLFDLENYLYQVYYEKFSQYEFIFNARDEKEFSRFIRRYIDLINARTFVKLQTEKVAIDFKEVFLPGGMLSLKFYNELSGKDNKSVMQAFAKVFSETSSVEGLTSFDELDQEIIKHKEYTARQFQKISFGSPFYAFKFLFQAERQMARLRIILKAKTLGMKRQEIEVLL